MTDERTYIVAILGVGIITFLIGLFFARIFSVVMLVLAVLGVIGGLYLAFRLVRAIERIADSMEQQSVETHTENASETTQ